MLRRRLLKAFAVILLLLVLAPAGHMLLEALFYPWARSFGLWPVLVGSWHGEMQSQTGTTGVFIEIRSAYLASSRSQHLLPITGRLLWCDGSPTIRDYVIRGDVESWRGRRFRLDIDAVESRGAGVSPDVLVGEWRGDTIEATGTLWRHGTSASVAVTRGSSPVSDEPGVHVTLQRGEESEFEAACRDGTFGRVPEEGQAPNAFGGAPRTPGSTSNSMPASGSSSR